MFCWAQLTILSCFSLLWGPSRNCTPAVVIPYADNLRKVCQLNDFCILKTSLFFFSISFYLKIHHSENTEPRKSKQTLNVSGHRQTYTAEVTPIVCAISTMVLCSLAAARGLQIQETRTKPVNTPPCTTWQLIQSSSTAAWISTPHLDIWSSIEVILSLWVVSWDSDVIDNHSLLANTWPHLCETTLVVSLSSFLRYNTISLFWGII